MYTVILTFILLFTTLTPSSAELQALAEKGGTPKIGIIYTAPHPVINEIIAGFKDVVGKRFPNAKFAERHADGRPEQYGVAVLATIGNEPDLLVPITTPITQLTVEQSRGRIPIVFMGVTDPVGAGVARSLDQPKLATGSSDLCPFSALLKITRKMLPKADVLGLPYNPTDQPAVFGRGQLIALAPTYGFSVVDRQVTSASELPIEVRGLASRVDAIILAADNLMMENPTGVATAAAEEGKPTFACDTASVEAGAVAGVSVKYRAVGEAAGERAVRVLSGEDPGQIPVGVLSSGGIAVNRQAACQNNILLKEDIVRSSINIFHPDFKCRVRRGNSVTR